MDGYGHSLHGWLGGGAVLAALGDIGTGRGVRTATPPAGSSIRPAGADHEFPASGLDAGRYVTVLQAELRAIASRLVMPEFMLSSDASNANYSSTLVAEGPAVKMFERLQNETTEDDLELLRRVLEKAVEAGRLPPAALTAVDIQATAPTLAAHDRLRDAQADAILVKSGAMSPATMAMRHGLDPGQERRQGAAASASARPAATLPADQPLGEWQFDPDEPRDWRGRWTTGGADAGGSKPGGSGASVGYFDVAPEGETPELPAERKDQLARAAAELDAKVKAGTMSKEERDLRYETIKAALGHKMGFSTEREPNPAYFEKRTEIVDGESNDTFHFKPGEATAGLHDRVYRISGIGSDTGCTRASQSIMAEGQAQFAKNNGKTAEFDKEVSGKTLADMYPKEAPSPYQSFQGDPSGLDPKAFVPGDRVRMDNHKFEKEKDGTGYEGSNVIYAGKDENGESQYVHMDGASVVDEGRLKKQVQGYTMDEDRQDKNIDNYKFKERYSPKARSY